MLNNRFNEKLNQEYPKDFSIHDIDGIAWVIYFKRGIRYMRLVMYETKWKREKFTGTQLEGFKMIRDAMNWKKFDKHSGYFIFRSVDENFNEIEVYDLEENHVETMTMDQVYEWVSAKDMTKKEWKRRIVGRQ